MITRTCGYERLARRCAVWFSTGPHVMTLSQMSLLAHVCAVLLFDRKGAREREISIAESLQPRRKYPCPTVCVCDSHRYIDTPTADTATDVLPSRVRVPDCKTKWPMLESADERLEDGSITAPGMRSEACRITENSWCCCEPCMMRWSCGSGCVAWLEAALRVRLARVELRSLTAPGVVLPKR